MAQNSVDALLKSAADSLQAGRSGDALRDLEHALQLSPDHPEAAMLMGMALAQSGRIDEATTSFRRATVLAPHNPKAFYNLAVHLYDQGNRVEAAAMASEALAISPNDPEARALLERCGVAPGAIPFSTPQGAVTPEAPAVRPGYDDPTARTLGLPEWWTAFGIVLCTLSVLSLAGWILHNPIRMLPSGPGGAPKFTTQPGTLTMIQFIAYPASALLQFLWLVMDLIDRRGRLIWLIPSMVCAFGAAHGLPFALYLFLSRKSEPLDN